MSGEPPTPRGGCPFCGYPLDGLESDSCPECGERIEPGAWARARPQRLERIAVSGLLVSGFVLSVSGVMSVIGIPMMLVGIAILGTPGGVGPRYRRFLLIAAVFSWLPALAVGLVLAGFLLRESGLLP